MDDPTLLHSFLRERSEPAFAELVARYLPLVHAAALRRLGGDEHRAREVTQMVFTELAQKAAKLAGHPALAAWLHQSTRWRAANLRRAERRRAQHETAAAEHLATTGAPGPAADWAALRPVLDEALDTLRETDRDAVLQRFMLDRPFAAIGEKLGVSENAARMRVDRALDTLRGALARHGIKSTPAALALALTHHAGATTPVGMSSTAIAATACQAATGAAAAGTTAILAMKIASGVAAAIAVGLATEWWHQEQLNAAMDHQFTTPPAHAAPSVAAPAAAAAPQTTLAPQILRDLEDEILAAAEFAVPLTPEQQERVRLDTIIRKGELDYEYAMLFRQLKLPAESLDAFKTLLVERRQAIYDAKQLAKEFRLEIATLAEDREIESSAVAGIDARISDLIGAEALAKFHEYEDLTLYRSAALGLVFGPVVPAATDPAKDVRVLELARQLQRAAPDLAAEQYRSNGWPVTPPAAYVDAIEAFLGPDAAAQYRKQTEQTRRWTRIREMERDAVLDGRIPTSTLSTKDVARRYEAARAQRAAAGQP